MDININYNLLLLTSAATMIYIASVIKKDRDRRKVKKKWAIQWLRRRENGRGVLNMLNQEILHEDPNMYCNFLRMPEHVFEKLLSLIEDDIKKQDTNMRQSISARNRLQVTLRFLATGETFRSLMYSTRIDETTISKFIPEVLAAIYNRLKGGYLKTPTTAAEWYAVAKNFEDIWQFPHCVRALDGRHIKFRAPRSDGSYYYNYKGEHSIVLLALVDASYKFIYCNVGINGRISDGGVFRESLLSEAIYNDNINFPQPEALPGRTRKIPYVIVADDAFPLHPNIMKPFPERGLTHTKKIFNYRLSRARRIVENAFGILANRFRILLNPINLRPEKVELITLCCVVLHNLLSKENTTGYLKAETDLKDNLPFLERHHGNRSTDHALLIREEFMEYFMDNGAVPWQDEAIQKHNL